MNKLESLRLEVDSRRRTVARLGKKVGRGAAVLLAFDGRNRTESANCCLPYLPAAPQAGFPPAAAAAAQVDLQRARLPQTRAKGEYEMENTIKVLQHKESKLSACRQSFKEHEALVYHQLTNLIRDTVWLKSYLSGAAGRGGVGSCSLVPCWSGLGWCCALRCCCCLPARQGRRRRVPSCPLCRMLLLKLLVPSPPCLPCCSGAARGGGGVPGGQCGAGPDAGGGAAGTQRGRPRGRLHPLLARGDCCGPRQHATAAAAGVHRGGERGHGYPGSACMAAAAAGSA